MTDFFNINYECGCKLPSVVIMYENQTKFIPIEFIICETHKQKWEEKKSR